MTQVRLPIYAKVLLWFMMNLVLLAALGYGFMRVQFRLGLDWMLAGATGDRIEKVANTLTSELDRQPQSAWPAILRRYSGERSIEFTLFSSDGSQLLGVPVEVPREVRIKLVDRRGGMRQSPPRRASPPPENRQRSEEQPPPKPRFILSTDAPTRYWTGIHVDTMYQDGDVYLPMTLVMISRSFLSGGLFFDPWPWLAVVIVGLLLSLLVWWPLVRGMTRFIQRLNGAARTIAHGRFEERVEENRGDELGELAVSVNAMASQLGDYVAEQRRITADVAHELCSPIARMQMALGVVEQRGTPEQAGYLRKLDAELQHMAKLVEEVMTFSKAASLPDREVAEEVDVLVLVERAIEREAAGQNVMVEVPEGLKIVTLREALDRALGNVLRNAIRYAVHVGPVKIEAKIEEGKLVICVSDVGPGVPADSLPKLFDPFYRPEVARARHTGGSGLGLAIVKRCIEACGGTVSARLREPQGLEVEMRLPV
jgi:two-component system, OmpR family, sensor histidine kinase CpxA